MPAHRVVAGTSQVGQFDVAGIDSPDVAQFVGHVGLIKEAGVVEPATSDVVRLIHMHVLVREGVLGPVRTVGTAQLDSAERMQIESFFDGIRSEFEAAKARGHRRQYIIFPHIQLPTKENSCHRFSCAGLVCAAYQYAGITLVDTSPGGLPAIDLTVMKTAYRGYEAELDSEETRREYGLTGAGPWEVVLPGYVMNSLRREAGAIRAIAHNVVAGEELFA